MQVVGHPAGGIQVFNLRQQPTLTIVQPPPASVNLLATEAGGYVINSHS